MRTALLTGGILGAAIFLVTWTVAGLQTSGYDVISQFNSELGAGSAAVIWNTGLIALGIGTIAFGFGVRKGFGRPLVIAPVILVVAGAGSAGAGLVPCDVGCPSEGSMTNTLHTISSIIAFGAIAFAPLVTAISLKRGDAQGAYRIYSLTTGVFGLVFFFVLVPLAVQGPLGPWKGLVETLNVTLIWVAWMGVTSVYLLWNGPSVGQTIQQD